MDLQLFFPEVKIFRSSTNTKIFVMLIWSLYLYLAYSKRIGLSVRAFDVIWIEKETKSYEVTWDGWTLPKEQPFILIHGEKKHAKDYRPNSKFPWCEIRVSEESSPGHALHTHSTYFINLGPTTSVPMLSFRNDSVEETVKI